MKAMSIRKDSIVFFERQLMDFFRKAGRIELPWRKRGMTAYEVWVSEIMLQQTQVARVIGYYTRFLERFPTVESLAKASWEEFLPYYVGLGYYARGRNMLRAAALITREHAGKFPRDTQTLKQIPGIGPYTAAAIQSFAYGQRRLAWDTNLRRVVGRFFYGKKRANIDTEYFEAQLLSTRKSLNAAMMDFGSALCVARPKCEACLLRSRCVYYQEGGKLEAKKQQKKVMRKEEWSMAEVVVILHNRHRQYYSSKRKTYAPFILSEVYNSRAGIKAYFSKKYKLTLAVRPPHWKRVTHGKYQIFVNAQILLGQPRFSTFPPEVVRPTLV